MLFRRIVLFVLLFVVLSVGTTLPTEAQSCTNSACILIVLKVYCTNGALPPHPGNTHYLSEIYGSVPYQLAGAPYLTGGGHTPQNERIYTAFMQGAIQNKAYQVRWVQTSGPWANAYSAWIYRTTGGWGSITTYNFLYQKDICS